MREKFKEPLHLPSLPNIFVERDVYEEGIDYTFLSGNEPISHLVIDNAIGDKLAAYHLIEKDLNSAYSMFKLLIDLNSTIPSKDLQGFGDQKNMDFVIAKSLNQSGIITYCKCFSNSSGGKKSKYKPRGVKLDKKFIDDLPSEQQEVHEVLMGVRNEYIAHGGASPYEASISIILLSKSLQMSDEILCIEAHAGGFNNQFYEIVLALIINLKNKLNDMQNKKRETLRKGYLANLSDEKIKEKSRITSTISLSSMS